MNRHLAPSFFGDFEGWMLDGMSGTLMSSPHPRSWLLVLWRLGEPLRKCCSEGDIILLYIIYILYMLYILYIRLCHVDIVHLYMYIYFLETMGTHNRHVEFFQI